MISQADVIVIGSGGLGAATAFYLAKRGAENVALVDKHDIGSQTSPRAAGMVNYVRKTSSALRPGHKVFSSPAAATSQDFRSRRQ